MTKSTPNKALERFIDTNENMVRVEGWVNRQKTEEEKGQGI